MEQKVNIVELSKENLTTGEIDVRYAYFPDRWMSLYNNDFRDLFCQDCRIILDERNDEINETLDNDDDRGWSLRNISLNEYIEAIGDCEAQLYDFR